MAGSTGECIVARWQLWHLHRWQLRLLSGGVSVGGWQKVWQHCFGDRTTPLWGSRHHLPSLDLSVYTGKYMEYHGLKHILPKHYSIHKKILFTNYQYRHHGNCEDSFYFIGFLKYPTTTVLCCTTLQYWVSFTIKWHSVEVMMMKHSPLLPPAVGNVIQQQSFHSGSEVILWGRPFCCACKSNTKRNGEIILQGVQFFCRYCKKLESNRFLMKEIRRRAEGVKSKEVCRIINFPKFVLHIQIYVHLLKYGVNVSNINVLSDTRAVFSIHQFL